MISSTECASSTSELLVLLRGSARSGRLATEALLHALADRDTGNEESKGPLLAELREVLHELCTGPLLSSNWTTRANSAYALHETFKRFDFLLAPLLQYSASDGDLLLLDELDVCAIVALGESSELRNGTHILESAPSSSSDELYKRAWLRKQRGALLRRLGQPVVMEGSGLGTEELVTSALLDWSDLRQQPRDPAAASAEGAGHRVVVGKKRVRPADDHEDDGGSSEETWLARLVRFLVVGLLDARWETRQGCSQGLVGLVKALYDPSEGAAAETGGEKESACAAPGGSSRLPAFLVEDLVCSSLCVLILDRFLDFGSGISASQPVKEAAGRLVACASRFCDAGKVSGIFAKVLFLCTYGADHSETVSAPSSSSSGRGGGGRGKSRSVTATTMSASAGPALSAAVSLAVRLGGFAALKYSLPLHFGRVSDRCLFSVAEVVASALHLPSDELNGAAAQLLRCFQHLRPAQQVGFNLPSAAAAMCGGLRVSARRLGSLDGRAEALCLALQSMSSMLLSLGGAGVPGLVAVAVLAVEACSDVLLALDLYTDDVRRRCVQPLLRAVGSIAALLRCCGSKGDGGAIVTCAGRLAAALLLSLSLRPSKSLGDLFLVSKAAQLSAAAEGPAVTGAAREVRTGDEYDDAGATLVTFLTAALGAASDLADDRSCQEISLDFIVYLIDWSSDTPHVAAAAAVPCLGAAEVAMRDAADGALRQALLRHIADNSDFESSCIGGSPQAPAMGCFYLCASKACRARLARVLADTVFSIEASRSLEDNCYFSPLVSPDLSGCIGTGSSSRARSIVEGVQAMFTSCLESLAAPLPGEAQRPPAAPPRLQVTFVADTPGRQAEGPHPAPPQQRADLYSRVSVARRRADLLLMLLCALAGRFSLYGSGVHGDLEGPFVERSLLLLRAVPRRSGLEASFAGNIGALLGCYSSAAAGDALGALSRLCMADGCGPSARSLLTRVAGNMLLLLVESSMLGGGGGEGDLLARAVQHLLHEACAGTSGAVDLVRYLAVRLQQNFFRHCMSLDLLLGDDSPLPKGARHMVLLAVVGQLGSVAAHALVEQGAVSLLVDGLLLGCMSDEGGGETAILLETAASTCAVLLRACAAEPVREQLVVQATGSLVVAAAAASIDSSDGARAVLARLLLLMVQALEENVVYCYDELLRLALSLLADSSPRARASAMACMRRVVPLAPIARDRMIRHHRVAATSDGSSVGIATGTTSAHELLLRAQAPSLHLPRAVEQYLEDRGVSLISAPCTSGAAQPSLRDYQRDGVRWLHQLRSNGLGGILADDMGLGKTVQALCLIAVARAEAALGSCPRLPSLVVCPSSLVATWHTEVLKFFPPTLLVPVLFSGSDSSALQQEGAVVIVSFTALRQHVSLLRNQLFEIIVVDEAHIIKNSATAAAQAVFKLRSRGMRIALSGTPVQNSVEELWSLMQFVMPDYLGAQQAFAAEFVRPIRKSFVQRQKLHLLDAGGDSSVDVGDASRGAIDVSAEGTHLLQRLHRLVLPFVLRRTKNRVASELPLKTVVDVLCPLSQLQRSMYRDFQRGVGTSDAQLESQLRTLLRSEELAEQPKVHPLRVLAYLKLLSVHPALVVGEAHGAYRRRLVADQSCSGKLHQLARLLLDAGVALPEECEGADGLYADDAGQATRPVEGNDDTGAMEGVTEADHWDGEGEETGESHATPHSDGRSGARAAVLGAQPSRSSARLEQQRQLQPAPRLAAPRCNSSIINKDAHRCLLFVQHRAALDMVEECVLRRFYPTLGYFRLDGSVPPAARAALVARFNDQGRSGEDIRLLIMTTKACGLGLNLVAADTAIFLEHDWNPFVDLQAMDRLHRIGQTRPVTVYRLLADSTVEARIMGLQGVKIDVVAEVINERNAEAVGGDRALQPALWGSLQLSAAGETGEAGEDGEYESMDLDVFLASVGCE